MHAFYGKEPRGGRLCWHIWQELVTTLLFLNLNRFPKSFKQATSKQFQTVVSYDQVVNCHRAVADCCQVFPKLLRCSEEPVINLLTRCYQIVKKQVNVSNFFVSAPFTFQHHIDQVFILPLSQWQNQAMTGPEFDKKEEKLTLYHLTLYRSSLCK